MVRPGEAHVQSSPSFVNFMLSLKGSHLECQYALMSFGISRHILPVDEVGKLHCRGLLQFLEGQHIQELKAKQQRIENEEYLQAQAQSNGTTNGQNGNNKKNGKSKGGKKSTTNGKDMDDDSNRRIFVAVANNQDVLFGRGKPYQVHPGNIRLAELIEERQVEYNRSNRSDKTSISWEIVHYILEQGGRFLKKEETLDMWEQVQYVVAREKVAHGFRTPHRGAADVPPPPPTTTSSPDKDDITTKHTTTTTKKTKKKKKTTPPTSSSPLLPPTTVCSDEMVALGGGDGGNKRIKVMTTDVR